MSEQCKFRQSYISATSFLSERVDTLINGNFDIALFASSWDLRSVAITNALGVHCTLGFGIFFDGRDEHGLRDRHDQKLSEYGSAVCDEFIAVTGPSNKVDEIWAQLEQPVTKLRESIGRPLKVLIDLSACPRFFSLGMLALCMRQQYADNVTIMYAEGEYPVVDTYNDYAFTGGRWQTIAIPYLEGTSDPGSRRFYLVSVGFEGPKTLRAVSQADPDRVSVLFPEPGTLPDYAHRTANINKPLIEEFWIPPEQIVKAPAGDAVAAFKAMEAASIDRRPGEQNSYLCCGTKPHSLALALRALALETPTVLYNIPEEHKVHATKPNGVFWKYVIQNVTALG